MPPATPTGNFTVTGPKILIVDDHPEFRLLLGHHLTAHWPDAAVQHHEAGASGRLPDSFSGAGNDLVLLGQPGPQADALAWLRHFRRISGFPPVVFLGTGDERQIIAAIKAGAKDYITKATLTHTRLIESVQNVLADDAPGSDAVAVKSASLTSGRAGLPSLRGYEFQQQLSFGEISAVYLAHERAAGRTVVLKILNQVPDRGEKVFDRFLQEYELIAKVNHPNVVRIYDLGVADDHAYIAMEHCGHGSLKRRISQGVHAAEAYAVMREIAGALGALHAVGIFHRDLKPTNVMFREDDSLVLIDFGLAKQAHFQAELTGTGAIFGTPYYMSPEQGTGGKADQRSDIYSLGIIFYEMLTGTKPFDGGTAMAVIMQHRDAPVPSLPATLRRYQPAIDKMLAKLPAHRFQDIGELLGWGPAAG